MKRFVIFNADDFGLCESTNRAIQRLFCNGFLTSASLMAPAPYAEEAIEIIKQYPQIKCGMHTTFTSEWSKCRWKPVSSRKELMEGEYFPRRKQNCQNLQILREEIEKQYRFFTEREIEINHVDDHMFSMNYKFVIMINLCKKFNLKLRFPGGTPGSMLSGSMDYGRRCLSDIGVDQQSDTEKYERYREQLPHVKNHVLLESDLGFLDELDDEPHAEADDEK